MTSMTHSTAQPGRLNGAATARRAVTLTGVQPTGDLHLGNYVGAIRPLADLAADPGREVYVFVADLHALNGCPEPAVLRDRCRRRPRPRREHGPLQLPGAHGRRHPRARR